MLSWYQLKNIIDVSTPNGRLFLTLLAAVAEFEREIIKEQMEENRFRLWKQGKIIIGKPLMDITGIKKKVSMKLIKQKH